MSNKDKVAPGPSLIAIFCAVRCGECEVVVVDSNLPHYEGHILTGVRCTLAAAVAPYEPARREQSRHG
jgi:hypothetical protein